MLTTPFVPTSIIVGPDRHGVVQHALATASATGAAVIRADAVDACPRLDTRTAGPSVHIDYTDRLFGPDAATAASAVRGLLRPYTGRVVLTLHDVPFLDDSAHHARRVSAYRSVMDRADVVLVSSHAEAARLRAIDGTADVRVVRLPIRRPLEAGVPAGVDVAVGVTIGVLGFVHPGKGHADVIEAADRLGCAASVTAIGSVSVGHESLAAELRRLADDRGIEFAITGYVDDDELTDTARRIVVPVMPSRSVSASASLATWIGAGRRPLVAASDYTTEFEALAPGLVELYDPLDVSALRTAIRRAVADPRSTWREGPVPPGLCEAATHAQLFDVYRTLS